MVPPLMVAVMTPVVIAASVMVPRAAPAARKHRAASCRPAAARHSPRANRLPAVTSPADNLRRADIHRALNIDRALDVDRPLHASRALDVDGSLHVHRPLDVNRPLHVHRPGRGGPPDRSPGVPVPVNVVPASVPADAVGPAVPLGGCGVGCCRQDPHPTKKGQHCGCGLRPEHGQTPFSRGWARPSWARPEPCSTALIDNIHQEIVSGKQLFF